MATYGGWTELREYRVWSAEDVWQVSTISKHSNGWYSVETDGYDMPYKTRSATYAHTVAQDRTKQGASEAQRDCPCGEWEPDEREECEDSMRNVYDSPHGVRVQIVEMAEHDLPDCD